MKNDFFLFYSSWYKVVKDLPAEIKIEIYEATIEYGLYGTTTELTPMANIAFGFIKDDIDRNAKTYEGIKKQRSEAGRKGSEARWGKPSQNNDGDQSQPVESDSTPPQPIADDNNQSQNIANDGKTSQSIANDNKNGKRWQTIATNGKNGIIKIKTRMKIKIKKFLSLLLPLNPTYRRKQRKREKEKILFSKIYFGLTGKNLKKKHNG